jgi:hypothetical protein
LAMQAGPTCQHWFGCNMYNLHHTYSCLEPLKSLTTTLQYLMSMFLH